MKHQAKLILFGMLSLTIGVAFASPLLVSELNIRPFSEPLPKGKPAEFGVNVVYANFSITENAGTTNEGQSLTSVSYFVVLNITNNGDEDAQLDWIDFFVCQNVTKGAPLFIINGTSMTGWEAKGAWVDGVWYNVTWTNGTWPYFDENGNLASPPFDGPDITGYWMEGVQIADKYVGGELTATYMNMNGTWVDVTGRINVTRPEGTNPFNNAVSMTGILFDETRFFGNITISEDSVGTSHTTVTPNEFTNVWAPHQSRLIVLSANDNKILSSILDSSTLEMVKSGQITLRTTVHGRLCGNILEIGDTSSVAEEIKQVQLDITENRYVYNTALAENQLFTTDKYGTEAFIETRR